MYTLAVGGVERAWGGPKEVILQMEGILSIALILGGFEGYYVVERSQFASNGCIYHVLHCLEHLQGFMCRGGSLAYGVSLQG